MWDGGAGEGAGIALRRGDGMGWGGGKWRKDGDVTSGARWLRLLAGPRDKMADLSLDELIRKRGVAGKGR